MKKNTSLKCGWLPVISQQQNWDSNHIGRFEMHTFQDIVKNLYILF